jgi:hypothetical protein
MNINGRGLKTLLDVLHLPAGTQPGEYNMRSHVVGTQRRFFLQVEFFIPLVPTHKHKSPSTIARNKRRSEQHRSRLQEHQAGLAATASVDPHNQTTVKSTVRSGVPVDPQPHAFFSASSPVTASAFSPTLKPTNASTQSISPTFVVQTGPGQSGTVSAQPSFLAVTTASGTVSQSTASQPIARGLANVDVKENESIPSRSHPPVSPNNGWGTGGKRKVIPSPQKHTNSSVTQDGSPRKRKSLARQWVYENNPALRVRLNRFGSVDKDQNAIVEKWEDKSAQRALMDYIFKIQLEAGIAYPDRIFLSSS